VALKITGISDPILATPFRIGETGAPALAAIGPAVADLWDANSRLAMIDRQVQPLSSA
jgi:hypothetical protein